MTMSNRYTCWLTYFFSLFRWTFKQNLRGNVFAFKSNIFEFERPTANPRVLISSICLSFSTSYFSYFFFLMKSLFLQPNRSLSRVDVVFFLIIASPIISFCRRSVRVSRISIDSLIITALFTEAWTHRNLHQT